MNATTADDPVLGDDPNRNNDFKFIRGDQKGCPFHAHIRKMNPRGDQSEDSIRQHLILRRGIPFGTEVSPEEKASSTTTSERGLLFVCYQSVINSGFSFLQQGTSPLPYTLRYIVTNALLAWANNDAFPFGSSPTPGKDPIIGQTVGNSPREITGAFANDTDKPLNLLTQWVNSKGGEYFFSPSLPALRDVFAISAA